MHERRISSQKQAKCVGAVAKSCGHRYSIPICWGNSIMIVQGEIYNNIGSELAAKA